MDRHFKRAYIILCLYSTGLIFSEFAIAQTPIALEDKTPPIVVTEQQSSANSQEATPAVQETAAQAPSTPDIKIEKGSDEGTSASVQLASDKHETDIQTEVPVTTQQILEESEPTEVSEVDALQKQLELLKLQHAVVAAQNLIQLEKYHQDLLELQREKDKLLLMNELQFEKTRSELASLLHEKEKRLLENELYAAQQTQLLAELETLKTRLVLENEVYEHEKMKMFAGIIKQHELIAMQNALLEETNKNEELKIQLESSKLNFEMTQLEFEKAKQGLQLEEIAQQISEREHYELWESQVNKPKEYLKDPFVDGHLTISDRKIELDLVIVPGVADYVNERIHYYNNKSTEAPIFLVINVCFGGSVMEGAKILEAMQSSRAPVYVVVKTLATSMAAIITTLAENSYAYPNAIIVHHQVLSIAAGNQKQIKEQLDIANEWTERVMHPVAKKMGITMVELVKKMYENNSTGEWHAFADDATKLKWVNTIVTDIRDTSFTKEPMDEDEEGGTNVVVLKTTSNEKIDSQGQRYVELPRLNPLDMYYLYNPSNYYR